MNKRNWLLISVVAVLAVAYVVFFTDWLNPTPIAIVTELREPMSRFGMGGRGGPGGPGGQRGNFRNGGGDNTARPEGRGGRGGQNRRNGQGGNRQDQANSAGDNGGGRPERPRRQGGGNGGEPPEKPTVYSVSFAFDDSYPLTSVKVVKVVKSGHAPIMWSLVNDGEPRGTKALVYGMPIRGMKLASNYTKPEPLEPGVDYELQIAAGRHKGKVVFHTKELPTPEESEPTAQN